MDPETTATLTALTGGVLGWAVGNLLDLYLPRLNITKSKPILFGAVVVSLLVILHLRFG